MSGVVTEAECQEAGLHNLLARAKAAMHDPAYAEVTAEYKLAGGLWDTSRACTTHQMFDILEQSGKP